MKRNFLVSTDCTGIFGSVDMWKSVWGSVLTHPSCKGVEMIGWRWSESLMHTAKEQNMSVIGIHGRTGGWREDKELKGRFMLSTINEFFLSNKALIRCGAKTEYILLHQSCLTKRLINTLIKQKDHIKRLHLENVISENALEENIETIQMLSERGLSMGMTFDLVHFLRDPLVKEHPTKSFDLLLRALESLSSLKVPLNIHFPIGTYESDSLAVYSFTKAMWKGLSNAINMANPMYIVLENQQKRAYSFYLPASKLQEVRKRNEDIMAMLVDWKIII